MGCCASVSQSKVGVVQRCGKFERLAQPGLNCLNPCQFESLAGTVNMRIRQLDVTCETKTQDNVFVEITVSVQFQVVPDNVYAAFYRLEDPTQQITAYVFDVVRAYVPAINLDDVFQTKDEIALSVKNGNNPLFYGFDIRGHNTCLITI